MDAARTNFPGAYAVPEEIKSKASGELAKGLDINELSQPTPSRVGVDQLTHQAMQQQAMDFFKRSQEPNNAAIRRLDNSKTPLTEEQVAKRNDLIEQNRQLQEMHDRISSGYAAGGSLWSTQGRMRTVQAIGQNVVREVGKLMSRADKGPEVIETAPKGVPGKIGGMVRRATGKATDFGSVHNEMRAKLPADKFARLEQIRRDAAERAAKNTGCPGL
jgi:hypothetical protein